MNIKIFADGSNIKEIFDLYENNKLVKGFTTNPSLMKKAGVTDYGSFIKEVTSKIKDLSISFEVFADDEKEMIYQESDENGTFLRTYDVFLQKWMLLK